MSEPIVMQVIYYNPKDYPGSWVVRSHFITPGKVEPGKMATVCQSLAEAREAIRPDSIRLGRSIGDEPQIYEVWI
jgi:hypothetical protein